MAGESEIRISTAIDNSGITPGLKETSKQIDTLTNRFDKQALSIRKQTIALEGMQKRLAELTDEGKRVELSKGIELAAEKLRITKNEAELTKNKLLELQNIQPLSDEQFETQKWESINSAYDAMIKKQNEMRSYTRESASNIDDVSENADKAAESFKSLKYDAKEIQSYMDQVSDSIKDVELTDEQFNKQTIEDVNAALERMIQRENAVRVSTDASASSLKEVANNADNASNSLRSVQYNAQEIQAAIDGIAAKSERVPLDFQSIADSVASIVPPIDDATRNMDGMSQKAQSMLSTFDRQYLAIQQQTVKLYEMKQAYDEMARSEGVDPQKLEKFGFQINSLTDKINLAATQANATRDKFEALISPKVEAKTKTLATNIKKVSRDTKSAGTQAHRAASGFEKMANRIGRLIVAAFVFNVIRRGLSELRKYLSGLVNTVPAFVQSLNEIKVNLATAFQPIAAYIIPAIIKLMQFLSIATAYIATFISALFGKTYEQSKAAAEAINKQSEALKNLKKEAKGVIAPFDKINKLSSETEEDAFSDLFGKVETPEIDMTFIDALKNGLLDVWEVFKQAWDNVGKYVMDGWKYALEQVWGLIKDIAKTFLEVWTDGHGQAFLESLLTLLGTLGYIIGDIAKAFREAWSVYGYDLVVSLFDMLKNVLDLLNSIGVAFREAWNDGLGVSIASNILQIFTNINNIISNLASRLREAWEANGNGVAIWQAILGIVDSVLGAINNITAATALWASELNLTPLVTGFRDLLEAIKPVVDVILSGLAGAYENVLLPLGKWLLELVAPVALDILAAAFDVISNTLLALQPYAIWFWEEFLKPIAEWTGGIIISILTTLLDLLEAFSDWISENQELVGAIAVNLGIFFAAWKVTELFAFIQTSGGVVAALLAMHGGLLKNIAAKIADKTQTIALTALYAKDFLSSLVKSTAALVKQSAQWIATTAAKAAATAATIAHTLATTAATAATWLFNAALAVLTSPITLIVLAIGVLIPIIVLLIKNWDAVKEAGTKAWAAIKSAWNAAGEWFNKTVITPIKNFFSDLWKTVKEAPQNALDAIKNAWNEVSNWFNTTVITPTKNFFDTLWKFVKEAPQNALSAIKSAWQSVSAWFSSTVIQPISGFFQRMWDGVVNMAKSVKTTLTTIFDGLVSIAKAPFNLIIDLLNGMIRGIVKGINAIIDAANKVKIPGTDIGVNISRVTAPQIPRLATGGIVNQATVAMIGERGKEAVLPLDQNTGWMDTLADKLASRINAGAPPAQNTGNQGATMQMDGRVFAELIWPYIKQNIQDLGISMASGSVF